jgi:hypothetical protein
MSSALQDLSSPASAITVGETATIKASSPQALPLPPRPAHPLVCAPSRVTAWHGRAGCQRRVIWIRHRPRCVGLAALISSSPRPSI